MFDTIVFTIALTFLIVLVVVFLGFEIRKRLYWSEAAATVLRYQIRRGNEGKYYAAVVRFQTPDGTEIVAISAHGSWRRAWDRGESILLRYDPSRPRLCEPKCFATQWGAILTGIALLIGFVAFAWYWPNP